MSSKTLKINFWPYSRVKDLLRFFMVFFLFFILVFFFPLVLSDPDQYHKATSFITPVHIKPEWYFLFAYAILRCVPNKAVRVLALVLSLLFLYVPILNNNKSSGRFLYNTLF